MALASDAVAMSLHLEPAVLPLDAHGGSASAGEQHTILVRVAIS
jgi:hypothetical protein